MLQGKAQPAKTVLKVFLNVLVTEFLIGGKICVLGLARTGLIFTGIQEGAQPGGGG